MATKLDGIFDGHKHLEEQLKLSQKEQDYSRTGKADPGFNPDSNAPVKTEDGKAHYIAHSELFDDGVTFDSLNDFLSWKKLTKEQYQSLPQIERNQLYNEYMARS